MKVRCACYANHASSPSDQSLYPDQANDFSMKYCIIFSLFIAKTALYVFSDKTQMVQFPRHHFSPFLLKQNKNNTVFTTK